MPPDLALLSTLIGSNYPCLELIFMVPKVFEPLKFDCILKILWTRGDIAPQEQFLLFSTIFCNLILDFCVKTRTRFSLQDKRLFKIIEVEITRVDCIISVFPNTTEFPKV